MPRSRLAQPKVATHVSIDIDNFSWVKIHLDGKLSKFLNDSIDRLRVTDPVEAVRRLSAEKTACAERMVQLDIEIQSATAECEKIKAEVPAEAAPVECRTRSKTPDTPQWMARLKRALAALDAKDRKSFLEKYEVARLALVDEKKALTMLAELETTTKDKLNRKE